MQTSVEINLTIVFQAIMKLSETCSQTVEHSCHLILLSGFSSWFGRDGKWNSYWHGDQKSDEYGCECALNQSCQGRDIEFIFSEYNFNNLYHIPNSTCQGNNK